MQCCLSKNGLKQVYDVRAVSWWL